MHYEFVNVKEMIAMRFRWCGSKDVVPRGPFTVAFNKLNGIPCPQTGARSAWGPPWSSAPWYL